VMIVSCTELITVHTYIQNPSSCKTCNRICNTVLHIRVPTICWGWTVVSNVGPFDVNIWEMKTSYTRWQEYARVEMARTAHDQSKAELGWGKEL
jgi:hypothetical protein